MKVGIPSEIKNNEFRVAITPAGVHEFRTPATRSTCRPAPASARRITDDEYVAAGARIVPDADDVWAHRRTWS